MFDFNDIETGNKINFDNHIWTRCWKNSCQLNALACMKSESLTW